MEVSTITIPAEAFVQLVSCRDACMILKNYLKDHRDYMDVDFARTVLSVIKNEE